MKSLAITVLLVAFLAPITAFAQEPLNNIIIETPQGSTSIALTVEGEIQYDGQLILYISGYFDSDTKMKVYEEYHTITADNPSHVFELDYPFRANEVYSLTAKNGPGGFGQLWIPNLVTQEASTSEVLETDFEQVQSTSVLISNEEGGRFVSVRDENKLLYDQVQNKNDVLMEQVMVIKDLASQISNVMYTNSLDSVSLTVAQVESTPKETFDGYVDYLSEDNILLSEEIEKKDAVLMEQLKVIQELASKVKNTVFEST